MALEDKIEAVKKVTQVLGQDALAEAPVEKARTAPNKEHFDALMNAEQQNDAARTSKVEPAAPSADAVASKPNSIMDEVAKLNSKVNNINQLTPEDLKNQAHQIIAQLEEAKTQLSQAGAEINPSYQNVLRNRLTHIDDNLKVALSKAGVEYTAPAVSQAGAANPIERFMGYLTQGQYQLEHLSQTIDQLNLTGAQLTPANMLALQIKVGQITQEIELFTNLLNKSLESTKTIMNVQV